jgi:hypothetical protein
MTSLLHEINQVLCSVHMVVVSMGNENGIEIAFLIVKELDTIVKKFLMVIDTSVNQESFFSSSDCINICTTEHAEIGILSWDHVNGTLLI